MEKQSHVSNRVNLQNKPIIPLSQVQTANTADMESSNQKDAGLLWGGLGLLALCGVCCSAPVLAGLSAMFGTVAVIGVAWPVIGLILAALLGVILLFRRLSRHTSTSGSIKNASKISTCNTNHCDATGACSCKK